MWWLYCGRQIVGNNKDMVAREGLEPPPASLFRGCALGGELAAPFMLRSSYCRSKAITSLVFRKIYRVFLRSRNTMCAWIVPRRVTAKYGLAILRQKGDLCKTEA
jgi:hypothetical protein